MHYSAGVRLFVCIRMCVYVMVQVFDERLNFIDPYGEIVPFVAAT